MGIGNRSGLGSLPDKWRMLRFRNEKTACLFYVRNAKSIGRTTISPLTDILEPIQTME